MTYSTTGETLSDATVLKELGIGSDRTVTLTLHHAQEVPSHTHPEENGAEGSSTHPEPAAIEPEVDPADGDREDTPPSPTHPHPGGDMIITSVKTGKEEKEVLVRIERSQFKKPFLGGYRHRLSDVEYHNAAIQTLPKPRPRKGVSYLTCVIANE